MLPTICDKHEVSCAWGGTSDLSLWLVDEPMTALLPESQQGTVKSLLEHSKVMNCAHDYSHLMFKSMATLNEQMVLWN